MTLIYTLHLMLLSLLFGLHQLIISYYTTLSAVTHSHCTDDQHDIYITLSCIKRQHEIVHFLDVAEPIENTEKRSFSEKKKPLPLCHFQRTVLLFFFLPMTSYLKYSDVTAILTLLNDSYSITALHIISHFLEWALLIGCSWTWLKTVYNSKHTSQCPKIGQSLNPLFITLTAVLS